MSCHDRRHFEPKARSGEWICTQKSFETLLEALQDVDQGRRRGFRRIPLSAQAFKFRTGGAEAGFGRLSRSRSRFKSASQAFWPMKIATWRARQGRYGLSAAEASMGMVYETFRTCM